MFWFWLTVFSRCCKMAFFEKAQKMCFFSTHWGFKRCLGLLSPSRHSIAETKNKLLTKHSNLGKMDKVTQNVTSILWWVQYWMFKGLPKCQFFSQGLENSVFAITGVFAKKYFCNFRNFRNPPTLPCPSPLPPLPVLQLLLLLLLITLHETIYY